MKYSLKYCEKDGYIDLCDELGCPLFAVYSPGFTDSEFTEGFRTNMGNYFRRERDLEGRYYIEHLEEYIAEMKKILVKELL